MWAEGPLDVGPGFETQGPTLGGILWSFFAFPHAGCPERLWRRALFRHGSGQRAQREGKVVVRVASYSDPDPSGLHGMNFMSAAVTGCAETVPAFLAQNRALGSTPCALRAAQTWACGMVSA